MQETALQRTGTRKSSVLAIAPDVACLELSIVNVYFVGQPRSGDGSWVLVDAGLPSSGPAILRAAEERFGPNARPAAIVLTHGHFDHRGSLEKLAEHWDVPVYAHRLELPYLTGRSDYPPPDPTVGGGAMAYSSRLFPRRAIDLGSRIQPLPEDGSVPGMPDWRWVHTPGHTPGHVSFFRETDRVLIAGDAFVTTRQESAIAALTKKEEVWRPPAYFTIDWGAARESVENLAALRPSVAATGHGHPFFGEPMRWQLDRLARDFDRYIPADGRYVRQPALADEQGIRLLPPAVPDRLPLLLGLVAVAALGTMIVRRRRNASEPVALLIIEEETWIEAV